MAGVFLLFEFKKRIRIVLKPLFYLFMDRLRSSQSNILSSFVTRISLSTADLIKIQKLPFVLRRVISLIQPGNPLKNVDLPIIDIAIPCHIKDLNNLPLVIKGAKKNVLNPIGRIVLITPLNLLETIQNEFTDCLVYTDESVLGNDILEAINKFVPESGRGWIRQQAIKFRIVCINNQSATLVLDADTVLLKPRVFLDSDNTQILLVGDDYHIPYKKHQRRFLGGKSHLLSFVTHHQLMKADTVKKIFGINCEGLTRWIASGDYLESNAISEFDTYAEYLVMEADKEGSNLIKFAKFNNLSVKVDPLVEKFDYLENRYSKYHSISNHHYLT
jgi:hypothetical protein